MSAPRLRAAYFEPASGKETAPARGEEAGALATYGGPAMNGDDEYRRQAADAEKQARSAKNDVDRESCCGSRRDG